VGSAVSVALSLSLAVKHSDSSATHRKSAHWYGVSGGHVTGWVGSAVSVALSLSLAVKHSDSSATHRKSAHWYGDSGGHVTGSEVRAD
jgi:hypothetical protein